MNKHWIKYEIIEKIEFPQHPYFCAIASCCAVANALLKKKYTQADLHSLYGIGSKSKLNVPLKFDFSTKRLNGKNPVGKGISNWDIIRLFNSIMLDNKSTPHSALLTGKNFAQIIINGNYRNIQDWLRKENNQVIIHLHNHYVVYAGGYSNGSGLEYIICGDSSKGKGPIRSVDLAELIKLSNKKDKYNRYGFIFLSNKKIPLKKIFNISLPEMQPKESANLERFG